MRRAFFVALLACVALTFACSVREEVVTKDVVTTIPWADGEEVRYTIFDEDGEEEKLHGVLTAILQDGEYELSLAFDGTGETAGDSDDTTVLVDATTLKPVQMERTIVREGETNAVRAEYDAAEDVVNITEIDADGDERLVPLRPGDNYYDNETSLYLWRTIDLREDYAAQYRAIIAGNRTETVVTLAVKEQEEIAVPAGTFNAWRVEVNAGDRRQVVWIADTPQRPVVQYDNSQGQLFKLTSISEP
jgi:hypothetical protein